MGACVMVCGKKDSKTLEHEKVYIESQQTTNIQEELRQQPQKIEVKLDEGMNPQPQIAKSTNLKRTVRTSIKSRFFKQKNGQEQINPNQQFCGATKSSSQTYPPNLSLSKTVKKNKKRHSMEDDWVDESIEKKTSKCSPREENIAKICYNYRIDKTEFICLFIKQKKDLFILQDGLELEDDIIIQSMKSALQPTDNKEKVRYKNGSFYCGQWMLAMRHGQGTLEWTDGCRYEGQWYRNNLEGYGQLTYSDGEKYLGEFKNNQASGKGQYYSSDGSTYNGQWKQSLQEGQGCQIFRTGEKYIGSWLRGKKNGYGQLYFEDGCSYYKGGFLNNELHGEGQYNCHGRNRYRGEWKHNQKSGKGCMQWDNGDRYEGDFLHDKMHGKGRFYDKDGILFQGNWFNGRREGIIMQTNTNGELKKGLWYFNRLLKYIQIIQNSLQEQKSMQLSI